MRKPNKRTCTVSKCNKPHNAKGYCQTHYLRYKKGQPIEKPETPEERFHAYVIKDNDCWLWSGPIDKNGYGFFWVKGKNVRAHRFSYDLFIGKIQKGKLICHSCDNPGCVNPKHLFSGTHQDNTDDMMKKGRNITVIVCGERNGRSKLTKKDVSKIRTLHKNGTKQADICRIFSVGRAHMSRIINNKLWSNV